MKDCILAGIVLLTGFFVSSCHSGRQNMDGKYRPEIHFTTGENWTGEPTGLLFHNGEYHLFYQYNPTQAVLGNICRGHAASNDLIHWSKLPVAIPSDSEGQIYPGSVVADLKNTSGLGSTKNPPLVSFYTCYNSEKINDNAKHSILMAYSVDNGQSWIKYNDPVLKNAEEPVFRNPKVFWNNVANKWLMLVSIGSGLQFYSSEDCIHWNYMSEFGSDLNTAGGWEGSDLFLMKIEGSALTKWVLMVSMNGGPANGAPATRYFVGDFDGQVFNPTQNKELWADYGKDFYAGTTFSNVDGDRRIMLGWMNCWNYANQLPTQAWRGSISFPRELSLVSEGDYYLLASKPIPELDAIAGKSTKIERLNISGEKEIFSDQSVLQKPFTLKLVFDNSDRYAIWGSRNFGVRLKTKSGKSVTIGYNAELKYYYINRSRLLDKPFSDSYEEQQGAAYFSQDETTDWFILVDHSSVELFSCHGRVAITSLFYSEEPFELIQAFSESGNKELKEAVLTPLNSN